PIITQKMVLSELVKVGMDKDVAKDLSFRYYRNELTHKDIEYLKENFDIKLEMLEKVLKGEILAVKTDLDNKIDTKFTELDNKIDNVRSELKSDIKDLDNKIDTVENNLNVKIDTKFNELDKKIDNTKSELKSDIKDLDNKFDTKFNELDKKIDINITKFDSTARLHKWMFGTIITINIGIFLALISIIYSVFGK
uniref:Bdr family repetitive protein n=1 Tax=Borrelia persica TaxID=44448 RepID=UPI0004667271